MYNSCSIPSPGPLKSHLQSIAISYFIYRQNIARNASKSLRRVGVMQSVQYFLPHAFKSAFYTLPTSTPVSVTYALLLAYTTYILVQKYLEYQVR